MLSAEKKTDSNPLCALNALAWRTALQSSSDASLSGLKLGQEISPYFLEKAGLNRNPNKVFGLTDLYLDPVLGIPVDRKDVSNQLTKTAQQDTQGQSHRYQQTAPMPVTRRDLLQQTVEAYVTEYKELLQHGSARLQCLLPIEFQKNFGELRYPVPWTKPEERSTHQIRQNQLISYRNTYRPEDRPFAPISAVPLERIKTFLILMRTDNWTPEKSTELQNAIEITLEAHQWQSRKATGAPYAIHPLETGSFIAALVDDDPVLPKGLLMHDIPEDAPGVLVQQPQEYPEDRVYSKFYYSIKKLMGKEIADLIMDLTKDEFNNNTWPYVEYSESQKGHHLSTLLRRPASTQASLEKAHNVARVRIGKTIDRLYNLRDWDGIPIKSAYGQLHETLHCIFPALEESLQVDMLDSHSKKSTVIKASYDVLDLLKWQWLASAVLFYKACRLRGVEPPDLYNSEDQRHTLQNLKKETVTPLSY